MKRSSSAFRHIPNGFDEAVCEVLVLKSKHY